MANNKKYASILALLIVLSAGLIVTNLRDSFSGSSKMAAAVVLSGVKNPIANTVASIDQGDYSSIVSINNEISKNMDAYKRETQSNNKQIQNNLIVNAVKQRKALASDLMKRNPLLFLSLALAPDIRAGLPSEAKQYVESYETITGTMEVWHIDDFNNSDKSHFEYFVNAPNKRYSMYSVKDLDVTSGLKVSISGYALDDQFVPEIDDSKFRVVESKVQLKKPNLPDSVGDQRTLVLLIKENSGDPEPFTTEKAYDLVFNGQFQNFMKEQSYGKVSFSGKVYGWYPVGHPLSCYGGDYGALPSSDELGNMVDKYDIDLRSYDRVVFLSASGGGGCSGVGKFPMKINGKFYNLSELIVEGMSNYNNPSGWGAQEFSWSNLDYVLSHEMGHSLGLLHANGWQCTDGNILYGDCNHVEYGNYYDTMGGYSFSLDYNAYFKYKLGWIPESQVVSITRSQSYSLNPLESVNGIKLAKIINPRDGSVPYAIEFRKGIGFDSNLNSINYANYIDLTGNTKGIFVNKIEPNDYAPATELLDMSPPPIVNGVISSVYDSISQVTLNVPIDNVSMVKSLNDPGTGIVIGPVTKVTESSVSFNAEINEPVCTQRDPVVDIKQISDSIMAGGSAYVYATFTNQDYGCGKSDFSVAINLPAGWSTSDMYPKNEVSLTPGKIGYINLRFTVSSDTISGNYPIDVEVTNHKSGKKKNALGYIYIIPTAVVTEVEPSFGKTGTIVKIKGTGFPDRPVELSFVGRTQSENIYGSRPKYNEISVTIPDTLTPQVYDISLVIDGAIIKAKTFEVTDSPFPSVAPSVTTSPPNLKLVYDKSGKEASLVVSASVSVTSGSEDQIIYQNGSIVGLLTDGIHTTNFWASNIAQSSSTIDNNDGTYTVPANTKGIFKVEAKFDPRKLFAGAYHASLTTAYIKSVTGLAQRIQIKPNVTDVVVIAGEVSPYIDSITPRTVPLNRIVTIGGVRFADINNVLNLYDNKTGKMYSRNISSTNKGKTIQFVPNVSAGFYSVQIINPATGASNIVQLNVTASETPSPVTQPRVQSPSYGSPNYGAQQPVQNYSGTYASPTSQTTSPSVTPTYTNQATYSPTPSSTYTSTPTITPYSSQTYSPTPTQTTSPTVTTTPSPSPSVTGYDYQSLQTGNVWTGVLKFISSIF